MYGGISIEFCNYIRIFPKVYILSICEQGVHKKFGSGKTTATDSCSIKPLIVRRYKRY